MLPIASAEFWVATEPTLDFTPNTGDAVCKFRAKAQDRTFDRTKNDWVNGKELWVNVTCWRKTAENTYESVRKGDNVVLIGKLYTREFQTNGVKREAVEFEAVEVGPSLRFRTTPHSDSAGQDRPAREPVATGTGARTSTPQNATQPADSEPPF